MVLLKHSLTVIYIFSIFLILTDVYGSNDRLQNYLGVDSRFIALIATVLLISLRVLYKQTLHKIITKINALLLLPVTLLTSIILTIWGFLAPPNFVYSLTHLQYQQIFLLAVFSGITALLQQPNKWFKKYASLLIFASGFALLALGAIVWLFPFEAFRILSHEDGFIEYLQVGALLLASFWCMKIVYKFFTKKILFQAAAFGLAGLLLFFVAGDEISWGQRLFEVQTPQTLLEQNSQGEITVHNLKNVQGYFDMGYIAISTFGTFAWILQKYFHFLKKVPYAYIIPPWHTSIYFFLGFVYFVWARYFPNKTIGHWSEFAELMLYTGIMFTIYSLAREIKSKKVIRFRKINLLRLRKALS